MLKQVTLKWLKSLADINNNSKAIEILEHISELEGLLHDVIAAYCGHRADVSREEALQVAMIKAESFLDVQSVEWEGLKDGRN